MLSERIKARIVWFKEQCKAIRYYGLPLWIVKKAVSKIYPRNRKIGIQLNELKTDIIIKYIAKTHGHCVKISSEESAHAIENNCPIWVCWWQGEESAPEIIKACISSIREHCGNHTVSVITWDNYSQYVEIPNAIIKRYQSGDIMPAHMADLLRCKLLTKYGGIWCDATIFMTDHIDEQIFDYSFYTIKHSLENCQKLELEPSKCYWRIFFMGTGKGNPLVRICGDILEEMLHEEKPIINYWAMDYIILMLYRQIPMIKEMIDAVPFNNLMPYQLSEKLSCKDSETLWKEICHSQSIHKLSWKSEVPNDTDSVYSNRVVKNRKEI